MNGCNVMLQSNLDALAAWSKLWQLNITIDKTFIIHIGKHNPIHVYTINSKAISVINVIKDLGVYISYDLTWNAHVIETANKAYRLANTILHSFHCHDVNIYLRAFDVFVQPILDYCCSIWNPALCYDIDSVENVKKAYTRCVFIKCMKPYAIYENRLAYLNRKTIETRRYIMSLTMFYNIFHKHVACNILNSFIASAHNRNPRGHHYKLFVPFCKTNIRKNLFSMRLLPIWNILLPEIVGPNVCSAFTYRLNNFNLASYFYLRYYVAFICSCSLLNSLI